MKKRLGELLLEKQLIDVDQLSAALAHQRQWGIRLGAALVAIGFIAEGTLMQVLSDALGLPMVDLSKVVVDKNALALVPVRVCEQYEVFPIAIREPKGGRRTLLLAMADPLNVTAVDEVGFLSDCIVKVGIAQATSIDQAIQRHHRGRKIEIAPMNFERPTPRAPSRTGMRPVGASMGGRSPSQSGMQGVGAEITATGARPRILPTNDFVDESSDPGRPVLLGQPTAGAHAAAVNTAASRAPAPASSSPLMAQATDPFSMTLEAYDGQPTGVFAMPAAMPAPSSPPVVAQGVVPSQPASSDREAFEALERKFWALMRVLHHRGQITREEFVAELGEEI